MRRKIPHRVCNCMPNGAVTRLEAHLLKELLNREIHPIHCAMSCKQKFRKACTSAICALRRATSGGY